MSKKEEFTLQSNHERGYRGREHDPIPEIEAIKEVTGLSFGKSLEKEVGKARKNCCDNPNCALIADYCVSNEWVGTEPHQMAGGPDQDIFATVATVTISCEARCPDGSNCVEELSEHLKTLGPTCMKAIEAASEKEEELLAAARKEANALMAPVRKEANEIKKVAQKKADKERTKILKDALK